MNRAAAKLANKMRKIAGLTQKELADKLDVPQSYISKIERGQIDISFNRLSKIAEACNMIIELNVFEKNGTNPRRLNQNLVYTQKLKKLINNKPSVLPPDLQIEWHHLKNGELKPSDVRPFSKKRVWWICKKGHEWQAPIYHRSRGTGCPFCAKNKKLTIEYAQNIAKKLGGKCLSKEYKNSQTPMLWKCSICGNCWEATLSSIKRGSWCPNCTRKNKTSKISNNNINPFKDKKEYERSIAARKTIDLSEFID